MKKRSISIFSLIIFLALLFSSNLLLAKEKPVLLKVPTTYASALPGLGTTTTWVAERISIVSNGSLKMKIYEPGKLVAPFEILDAVLLLLKPADGLKKKLILWMTSKGLKSDITALEARSFRNWAHR